MPAIVSCFTNTYGRFGARAAIERVRSAGLEYVELPIRTAGVASIFGDEPLLTHRSRYADVREVERLLAEHDVRPSSCNVTSGNPLDEGVLHVVLTKLELAACLGVSLVVGNAGEADDAEDETRLLLHLERIGDRCAKLGITYCFETHPGLCRDHRGMLKTMESLDHPHLKLNFDTGNISYYNAGVVGEVALAKVCQHVRHVHLKDHNGHAGDWYFPALGYAGAVDFVRTLELMRTVGFTGPWSIEIEGVEGEELTLDEYQDRLAISVEHLEACGYFD